ncbi:hypothetical protein C8R45DRAFT_1163941 [Mycena sanguinolenta]|nr:hypothetical protein C8R45DRAFT_1163941 [Mycena sanguinolenta]
MYALSWAIRSKPEWQRKSSDPAMVQKWREEALDQQEGLKLEQKLTPNMVNYVLTELAGYARLSDPVTGIQCGPFDAIWYSDRLISSELSDRLRAAVVELENVPDNLKDWHPRSNNQVLDLVHPSLYCVVYGRTCYSKLTMPQPPLWFKPPEVDDDWTQDHIRKMDSVSPRFCWLPSDFTIDTTDGSANLISPYINNLHPTKHKAMYPIIESILSSFIPLFEHVLSQINGQDKDIFRDIPPGSGRMKTKSVYGTWAGYNCKHVGETIPCIWSDGGVNYKDGMTDAEYEELREEAPKILPEAHEPYTGELENSIAPYSLRGRTIQCIIKLANIQLTPENPEYKAGMWKRLEFMYVSGSLAFLPEGSRQYYDEENISESRLAFRVTTGAPTYHVQDDELCMDILYGLKRDTHCCQDLGSIVRDNGRSCPRWPNVYQHCVAPFRLLDPSKPGHRKIIAIFLVDPAIERIPSATDIPPQQVDWILDIMQEAQGDLNSLFSRLPLELLCLVCDHLPSTFMTRQEAEGYRLEIMDERTGVGQERAKELSYTFNMCEH